MNSPNDSVGRIPWWVGLAAFSFLSLLLILFSMIVTTVLVATGAPVELIGQLASPPGLAIQVVAVSTLFSSVALLVPWIARIPVKTWIRLTPVSPSVFSVSCFGVLGLGFLVDEVTFVLHSLDPILFATDGLDLFNQLFLDATPLLFLILTAAITLGPGIGEELLFRGLLLRSFLSGMAPWLALLFSSILFGAIHLNILQGVGAGLIGIYLGFVALRTGSILPAMAAHALNNFICALFARFGDDMGGVWQNGHPLPVVGIALIVFIVALFSLLRCTRRPARASMPNSLPVEEIDAT